MSQSDQPLRGHEAAKKIDPVLHPQDAPGDMPDIAGEYSTIGVDKDFWKKPFVEVEKDKKTGKSKTVI